MSTPRKPAARSPVSSEASAPPQVRDVSHAGTDVPATAEIPPSAGPPPTAPEAPSATAQAPARTDDAALREDLLRPEEQTAPGLGAMMERMRRDADARLQRALERHSSREDRYREGVLELFLAMRPTFGPANAWLFNERARKREDFASKLGIDPANDAFPSHILDRFGQDLEDVVETLRRAPFDVTLETATTSEIAWNPRTPGRRIRVVDLTRWVEYRPPYAGPSAGPPDEPQRVHPRLTLYLFPLIRLETRESIVSRLQSGTLIGVCDVAVVFVLQPPQSKDSDDGGLMHRILHELFPSAPETPDGAHTGGGLPDLATALEVESARLERGVLHVVGAREPNLKDRGPMPDVRAILWTDHRGADVSRTLIPIP